MSDNILLNKKLLDDCLEELARQLKKRTKNKSVNCELVIVGGASIIVNYSFRQSTMDIDCIDENNILMNDVVNYVTEKFGLKDGWINTSFANTSSYSRKLIQYSAFYKTYGFGFLTVITIKDEYLLAMKIMSGRKYKNDYSDIIGIIQENRNSGKIITKESISKALNDLYGANDYSSLESLKFTYNVLENPDKFNFEAMKSNERANATKIESQIDNDSKEVTIEEILKKLGL